MLAAVTARLEEYMPSLAGRIEGAASLAQLLQNKSLPQAEMTAFLVPLALRGRGGEAATGIFRQMFDEVLSIVLVIRTNSRIGTAALPDLRAAIFETISAIAGWAPAGQIGVFALSSAKLISMAEGTIFYQIDFAIADQLRITP